MGNKRHAKKIDMPIKKAESKTNKTQNKYANGIKQINEKFSQNLVPYEDSVRITENEKKIMNVIFKWGQGRYTSISNLHIAHECRCSEQSVSNSISKLVNMGYLTRIKEDADKKRMLAITSEDIKYIWACEKDHAIEYKNKLIKHNPQYYAKVVKERAANIQYRKEHPKEFWSGVDLLNKGGIYNEEIEQNEEDYGYLDANIKEYEGEEIQYVKNQNTSTDSEPNMGKILDNVNPTIRKDNPTSKKDNPTSKKDNPRISKNTEKTEKNAECSITKDNFGIKENNPRSNSFGTEKSREPAPIAESRDFEKSRIIYNIEASKNKENKTVSKETILPSLSKERLGGSLFSKENIRTASEPSVRQSPVELKKNPGEKNKTSSERIMPIDDDPPESEDFLREQYAAYLNQILLKEIEDSLVEDKDFLEAEYSTFCQQTFLKAEADKDPVPDDDDSPYYNQNRPAPPPPRKLSKEEEWAKWHLTAEDKAYIEKRRLERLAEEAEAKAKLDEEKKKYDEEEARLARMTPEEQWEEIYGKREGEYKNAVVSAYAHDLPEWIEKTSRMYRHLFKKDYVPTQEEIDLFRAKLKANQMNENNGNGKRSPKKNIPKIGLIDPNYVEIDEDCREIIDYWEKMGFPKVKEKEMKKTVENILMFLNGTMKKCLPESMFEGGYHSFSKEQMIQAINNRHIKAFNDEYMPTEEFKKKMRRTTLQSWFYIPGNVPIPSPFVYDLANKPWKNKNAGKEQIQDVNPAFTNLIKKQYVEKVIGIEPKKWSFEDEKRFRMATKRFEDFRRENAKRLDPIILNPPTVDSIASLFFRSVGHAVDFNWGNINIGWLCSDKQFDERLPYYLQQQGFMRN